MERMSLEDGMRTVVNALTDANPTDLQFNDSEESDSATSPLAIALRVKTAKFVGAIKIGDDRGSDTYFVELTPYQGESKKQEWIQFDEIGPVLIEHVDDGSWNKVQAEKLKRAAKPRKALDALAA
jgi:hypothetical protein